MQRVNFEQILIPRVFGQCIMLTRQQAVRSHEVVSNLDPLWYSMTLSAMQSEPENAATQQRFICRVCG